NERTMYAGFAKIPDIIFEEAGIISDGAKLWRYLSRSGKENYLGGRGVQYALSEAGFDYAEEQKRSVLVREDGKEVNSLLVKLDKQGVLLDDTAFIQGNEKIDKAVQEHTHSNLGAEELWFAIRAYHPGVGAVRAVKEALAEAHIDLERHGLGQLR